MHASSKHGDIYNAALSDYNNDNVSSWVPPEIKDPVLFHAPTRKSVGSFGAVSLVSSKFVRAMCERFDALTFEAFLKRLLRHRSRGKRIVVVFDNARYHHAVLLATLLKKYRNVLTLLFLPPYSPQSSEFGNWPSAWQRITASSPAWTTCSPQSTYASIVGRTRILCCAGYAALFKTLCLACSQNTRTITRVAIFTARPTALLRNATPYCAMAFAGAGMPDARPPPPAATRAAISAPRSFPSVAALRKVLPVASA